MQQGDASRWLAAMRAQLTRPDTPANGSPYHAAAALWYSQVKQTRSFRYLNVTQRAIPHSRRRVLAGDLPDRAAGRGAALASSDDFKEFYLASYGRTLATVAALVGSEHEAEDIAQEAYARALARWS